MLEKHKEIIESAWDNKMNDPSAMSDVVHDILNSLDSGRLRICEKIDGNWVLHEWLKKAVSLFFRVNELTLMHDITGRCFDRIPLKFSRWGVDDFKNAGIRVVPGAIVRFSAYLAPGVVVMPSFVNVGAFVGAKTMIDSGVTIGSCCQIGENCHISSSAVIGGVLEPIQAKPVIIEDNCFIGAQSSILEGAVVSVGSVIASGVIITSSTKVYDASTGEFTVGYVPPYSVVIPGSITKDRGLSYSCAVLVKRVDEQTRSKTSINELLREHAS